MKPLKPSMRENRRYLLVHGHIENIERAILEFIGVLGMSKASLDWIKREKGRAIISVNRNSVNYVKASFAAWHEDIEVKRVSGTLKGLRQKTF